MTSPEFPHFCNNEKGEKAMKKLTKILVLVLSVALLLATLMLVTSAAEAETAPVATTEKVFHVYTDKTDYETAKKSGVDTTVDGYVGSYATFGEVLTATKDGAKGSVEYFVFLSGDWEEGYNYTGTHYGSKAGQANGTYVLDSRKLVLDLNGNTMSFSYNRKIDSAGKNTVVSYQRINAGSSTFTIIGNGGQMRTSSNLIQLAGSATLNIDGGKGGITFHTVQGWVHDTRDATGASDCLNTLTTSNDYFPGHEGVIKCWKNSGALQHKNVINLLGKIDYLNANWGCYNFIYAVSTKNAMTINVGSEVDDRTVRDTSVITMTVDTSANIYHPANTTVNGTVITKRNVFKNVFIGNYDIDAATNSANAILCNINVNNATVYMPDSSFVAVGTNLGGYQQSGNTYYYQSRNNDPTVGNAMTADDIIACNFKNSTFKFDKATGSAVSGILIDYKIPYDINIKGCEIYDDNTLILGTRGMRNAITTSNASSVRSVTYITDSYVSVVNASSGNVTTFSQNVGTLVAEDCLFNVGAFTNIGIYWLDQIKSDTGVDTTVDWPWYASRMGGYGVWLKDGNAVTTNGNKGNDKNSRNSPGAAVGTGWNANKFGQGIATNNISTSYKIRTRWGNVAYLINESAAATVNTDQYTFQGTAGSELKDLTTGNTTSFLGLSYFCMGQSVNGAYQSRRGKFTAAKNEYYDPDGANTYLVHSYYAKDGTTYYNADPYISFARDEKFNATTTATYPINKYGYYALDFDLMTPTDKFTEGFRPEFRFYDYSTGTPVSSIINLQMSADGVWTAGDSSYAMEYIPGVWQHITFIVEMATKADGSIDFGENLKNNTKLHLAIDGKIVHTFEKVFDANAATSFLNGEKLGNGAFREIRIYFTKAGHADPSSENYNDDQLAMDNLMFTRHSIDTSLDAADMAFHGISRYIYNLGGTFECPKNLIFAKLGDDLIYPDVASDELLVQYINSLTPASLELFNDYDKTFDVSKAGNFTFFAYKTNGHTIPLSEELPTVYDEATDILTVYGPGAFALAYLNEAAYLLDKKDGNLTDFDARIASLSDIVYWADKLGSRYIVFTSDYIEGTDALDKINRNGDDEFTFEAYEHNDAIAFSYVSDFVIDLNGHDLTLEYFKHIPKGGSSAAFFTYQRLQVNNGDVTLRGNGGTVASSAALVQHNGHNGSFTVDGGNGGITLKVINGKQLDENTMQTTVLTDAAGGDEGFFKLGYEDADGTNNTLTFLGEVNVNWNENTAFRHFITMYPQRYNGADKPGNFLNIGKDTGDASDRSSAILNVSFGLSTRKQLISHRDDYGTNLKGEGIVVRSTVNINNATVINPDMYLTGTYNKNFNSSDNDYVFYNVNNSKLDFAGSTVLNGTSAYNKTFDLTYAFPIKATFTGCEWYDDEAMVATNLGNVMPKSAYLFDECYISVVKNGSPTTFTQGFITCVVENSYLDVGYVSNGAMYWLDYDNGNGKLKDGTSPAWPWYASEVGGIGFYVKDGCAFSNTSGGKGNNGSASQYPGATHPTAKNNGGSGGNKLGSLGVTDIAKNGALLPKWGLYGYVVDNAKDPNLTTGTEVGTFDGTVGAELKDYSASYTKVFLGYTFCVGDKNKTIRVGKFTAAANGYSDKAGNNTYVVHSYYQPASNVSTSAPYISLGSGNKVNNAYNYTTAINHSVIDYRYYAIDFDLMTPTDSFTRKFNPSFVFNNYYAAGKAHMTTAGILLHEDGTWTNTDNKATATAENTYNMPFTPGVWQHITLVLELPVAEGKVDITKLSGANVVIHLYVDGVKVADFDNVCSNANLADVSKYKVVDGKTSYNYAGVSEVRIGYTNGSHANADNSKTALDNLSFRRYRVSYEGGADGAASFININKEALNIITPDDLPFATYGDVVIEAEDAEAGLKTYLEKYLKGETNEILNLYTDYKGTPDLLAIATEVGKALELKYYGNGYEIPLALHCVSNTADGITVITEQAKFTVTWYARDNQTVEKTETVYEGTVITAPELKDVSSNGWYKITEKWYDKADDSQLTADTVTATKNVEYYRANTYVAGMTLMQYNLSLMGHVEAMLYIPTDNIPDEVVSNTLYQITTKTENGVTTVTRTAKSGEAVKFGGANYNRYKDFYFGALSIANPLTFEIDTVVKTPDGEVTLTSKFSISPLNYINYIISAPDYYADEMPVIANMLQYSMELYKQSNGQNVDITKASFYSAYEACLAKDEDGKYLYLTDLTDESQVSFSKAIAKKADTAALLEYASVVKYMAHGYESGFAFDFVAPKTDADGNYVSHYVKNVSFVIDGYLDTDAGTAEYDYKINSGTVTYGYRPVSNNVYTTTYSDSPLMLKTAVSNSISIHNITDEAITVVFTVVDENGNDKTVRGVYNMDAYYYSIKDSDADFATFLLAVKAYSDAATYYRYGNVHHYPNPTDEEITVSYADFGAVVDDGKDDIAAIRKAHNYANSLAKYGYTNVTVVADEGEYYIGNQGSSSIVIKTNTDWTKATFYLDDQTVANNEGARYTPLFKVASDYDRTILNGSFGSLTTASESINYAPGFEALVILVNTTKKNYIRYGSNADNGFDQQDLVHVDADGNLIKKNGKVTTPLLFDMENVNKMEIIRVDDAPITIKGGNFITNYNHGHSYVNYSAYARGVLIQRSNVTFTGATHSIKEGSYERVANAYMGASLKGAANGEAYYTELYKSGTGDAATFTAYFYTGFNGDAKDTANRTEDQIIKEALEFTYSGKNADGYATYASADGKYTIVENGGTDYITYNNTKVNAFYKGAPLSYFVRAEKANNVTVEDCTFVCPDTFYYMGTGGKMVSMGSYANTAGYCDNITWKNCVQSDFYDDKGDVDDKGQMGTNYCKNMYFIGNTLSRFDAHKGAGNITIEDCIINRVNLIGGGDVLIKNTTFQPAADYMVSLREDYGAFWMGDVTFENVTVISEADIVALFKVHHYEHDYGYDTTMPTNVYLKGLTMYTKARKNMQLATGNINANKYNVTTASVNPYKVTENFIITGEVNGYTYTRDADGKIVRNADGSIKQSGSYAVNFIPYEGWQTETDGSFDGVNIDTTGITNK